MSLSKSLSCKSGAGFTIIELLVAISIIGLLSSIVLVNLNLPERRRQAQIAKSLEFSQTIQNAIGSEAVGIWSFDEGIGNIVHDTSGYGNNGTLSGSSIPSFTEDTPQKVIGTGSGKRALSFNGAGYVDCGNGASLNITTSPITIEAWVKANDFGGADARDIVSKEISQTGYTLRLTGGTGNRAQIYFFGVTGFQSNALLSTGVWYHLVGTYDKTYVRLYINGNLDKSVAATGDINSSSVSVKIGAFGNLNFRFFDGLIDEVRIYSQALSANEIQQHYVEGLKNHPLAQK